jgi:dGTPase
MPDDPSELEEHRNAVRRRIQGAIKSGCLDLNEILARCEGADPAVVASLLVEEAGRNQAPKSSVDSIEYDSVSTLYYSLPAPDPSRSQWWFSTAGVTHLLDRIGARIGLFESPRILCLGTPTLAPNLARHSLPLDILDVDPQVLAALSPLGASTTLRGYDAADPLPAELANRSQIAVLDPPWYAEAIYTFLNRAIEAVTIGGEIFCTLPGRLTRPGIETLHASLVNALVVAGHHVLAVEHDTVRYQVPRFELAALEHLKGFRGIPWRAGDLIHVRKASEATLPQKPLTKESVHAFARNPSEFRIFVSGTERAKQVVAKMLLHYSANVSTRAYPDEIPDVWSTEKAGIQVSALAPIQSALEAWSTDRLDKRATIERLVQIGNPQDYASEVINKLDEVFCLWSKFSAEPPLRSDEDIEKARRLSLTAWATSPTKREYPEKPDSFRGQYQRDRDRILWSPALRRLSNKTQLFPVQHDDDLRQRLTHSVEVFQLASTIGISFGLDGDLIEAGALAHDIGHTPFGHAGEHSLHKLFTLIHEELGGFNHYEHGVDVIRYLEGPYYVSSVTPLFGLNLTPEVLECVLKHTYCHSGNQFGTEELLTRSKHGDIIQSGYCHLEGQAVRIADKISYLVSDLEDGIRLGVLSIADILSCRFFHRPPLNFLAESDRTLHRQFADQRRWILKSLMEDVLKTSSRQLARLGGASPVRVRGAGYYLIQQSPEMLADLEEIWRKLQVGQLHQDRRVLAANLHAARIVAELTLAFSIMPQLMDERFCQEHERLWGSKYLEYYRKRVGGRTNFRRELVSFLPMHLMIGTNHPLGADITVEVEKLIMAKDYVAALSDSRARLLHRQMLDSQTLTYL